MNKKSIYFKTDFTVILASEAQWGGCPFRLLFYTASPSRSFVASFDGENYENCRLLDDGRLEIAFNQKDGTVQNLMGIGTLMCAPEFYLDNEAFRDHVCNQFVKPFAPVFLEREETTEEGMFNGFGLYASQRPTGTIGEKLRLSYEDGISASAPLSLNAGEIFTYECHHYTDGGIYQVDGEYGPNATITCVCSNASPSFVVPEDGQYVHLNTSSVSVEEPYTRTQVIETPYCLSLDLQGSSTIETVGTLPAFYQKGDKGDKGDSDAIDLTELFHGQPMEGTLADLGKHYLYMVVSGMTVSLAVQRSAFELYIIMDEVPPNIAGGDSTYIIRTFTPVYENDGVLTVGESVVRNIGYVVL